MNVRWALVVLAGCGRIGFDGAGDAGSMDDGATEGDSSTDASLPPFGACASGATSVDDFSDPNPTPLFTSNSSTNITATEGDGQLKITFGANVPQGETAQYVSNALYPSTGVCIELQVVQPPDNFGSMFFRYAGNNVSVGFVTSGETISTAIDMGVATQAASFGFGIANHPYWRLDVRDQDVRFWTSIDGTAWTLVNAQEDAFPDADGRLLIGGGALNAPVSVGGIALFERVAIGLD